jgi:hypothetical protein
VPPSALMPTPMTMTPTTTIAANKPSGLRRNDPTTRLSDARPLSDPLVRGTRKSPQPAEADPMRTLDT